jgi:hypothetical protein
LCRRYVEAVRVSKAGEVETICTEYYEAGLYKLYSVVP